MYGIGGALSEVCNQQGFEVAQYTLAEYCGAIVMLGILLLAKYRAKIPLRDVLQLLALGAVGAFAAIAYYFAIDLLSVGQAVSSQFQYIWIMVIMQAVYSRALPTKITVVAALLTIIGTVLGSGFLDELVGGKAVMNPVGLISAVACAVFYATHVFANGHVAVDQPAVPRAFFQAVSGLVVSTVFLFAVGQQSLDFAGILPWTIVLGLTMNMLPVIFIIIASRKLNGGIVGILLSAELPVAVIMGVLVLGESVNIVRIIGLVIIVAGVILSQLDDVRASSSVHDEA